jgi:hypothetical protein
MVQQTRTRLLSLLGFVYWGDFADLTLYKSARGKIVLFHKTWPEVPGSPEQLALRQQMRDAATAWRTLTTPQRQAWELASRKASLCMTGYNLFVWFAFTQDLSTLDTIQRQTKTTLTH